MSELPTLHDAQAGQESLFSRPLRTPLPERAGVEAPSIPSAPVCRHTLCHNCGDIMPANAVKCSGCGVWQREPEKRVRVARETITIQLADSGGPGDAPMNSRMKMALKTLGRRFKLRVVSMTGGTP